MQQISYLHLPNCFRLTNGTIEVIVTTDVGPRVIRYGFVGGENILGETPELSQLTSLGEWKPWGGHRLWVAPEAMPHSYHPDNLPVDYTVDGELSITLIAPIEGVTGLQKEMTVSLDSSGSGVTLSHRIINHNLWGIEAAPWALTIMRGGGVAILPGEPYRSHGDALHPARQLVLWHYTDLTDSRWRLGRRYIQLCCDPSLPEPQKIGAGNRAGWCAYVVEDLLFIKRFPYNEGETYPDFGCNTEIFTAGSFIELESLSPLQQLAPGEHTAHREKWGLYRDVVIDDGEESIDAAISVRLPTMGE